MNIRSITLILAGFLTLGSHAQESYTLTLPQAREYALQHNKTLLNARDQASATKAKYRETLAQGLPQIDGSLDYLTYFNYELNFSMGSGEEPQIDYSLLDAGDFEVLDALGQMFSSEPIVMGDQLTGKVQASQLIFSGQFWAGLRMAKIARKLADQNVAASENDVIENITNTYCLILTSEQILRILADNFNNLEKILDHTRNYFKAGIAEETDVDQIRITVSQLENTRKSMERLLQLNYNMFKFQLGVAPDTRIVLADSLEQVLGLINPDATIDPDFDIKQNINFQLMESQVLLTKKQLDLQKWGYGPTIAGFYSYTEKFVSSGFDLTPNSVAGISLSVPLFSSGMRNARVSQSRINLDIAQRNQEMVRDQLELQKSQLVYNYQNAIENYNVQKENIEVAGRVYRSIQNKYQQGMASSLDLTQANSNFLTAENNYLSSAMTLLQAKTSLEKLYNRL